jgi:hypothetical protein
VPPSNRDFNPESTTRFSSTWRDPGFTSKETSGCTLYFSSTLATTSRSFNEELAQDPMITWATGLPASSATLFTLSGEEGQAQRGSNLERSTSMISSYWAFSSGKSSTKSCSLPWAISHLRVISSDGKILVVAPISVPKLQMVALSGTLRYFIPGPKYSKIFPKPPFTVSLERR